MRLDAVKIHKCLRVRSCSIETILGAEVLWFLAFVGAV